MTNITIYHNPRCSKSRQALAILHENGHEPEIVKYLQSPPSIEQLQYILSVLKIQPRALMRKNEAEYKANNMANPSLSDEQLIELMHKFPKVIERPIVINGDKVAIGRPPENILKII